MAVRKFSQVIRYVPEAMAGTIVLSVVWLLFTYTNTLVSNEYLLRWLPNTVINGIDLAAIDFFRGFDAAAFDGGLRPRFISHSLTVLSVKFRLWLYGFFVPFPNLSIAFIVSVVFSPFLYYFFAKKMLGSRNAAFFATCVYLTSVGFLSTTALVHQFGKTLNLPFALLLFLFMAHLHVQQAPLYFGREQWKIVAVVMGLNFIGIMVDDTYAIIALASVALFYRVFWPRRLDLVEFGESARSLILFFSPFLLFAASVSVLPDLLSRFPGIFVQEPSQDFLSFVVSEVTAKAHVDQVLFSNIWQSFVITAKSYFSPVALATHFRRMGFGGTDSIFYLANWGLLLLFVLPIFTFFLRGQKKSIVLNASLLGDRLLWGVLPAIVICTVSITFIAQFHNNSFVTGFGKGSPVSVFLPILIVPLFMRWERVPSAVVKSILIGVMVIAISNAFFFVGERKYQESKYITDLSSGRYPKHLYPFKPGEDFSEVKLFSAERRSVFWSPFYERETKKKLHLLWRQWKDGRPVDFSKIGPWDAETMWFLAEMYYLQGVPSLRGNGNMSVQKGTLLFKARAKARTTGIALPPQIKAEIEAEEKATATAKAKALAQSQAPEPGLAGGGVKNSAEYRRQKNIAEFKKWRQSVPDYEKRLYDRVKKLNKRLVKLKGILIGGIIVILLVLFGGFYAVLARLRKNHSDDVTSDSQ